MARVRLLAVLTLGLCAIACDKAEPPPAEQPAAVEPPTVGASSEQVAAAPLPSPSIEAPPAPSGSAAPADSASAPDPQGARKVAREQAASAGIPGLPSTANPKALVAPWGTTELIGEDPPGGLIGDDVGEPFDPGRAR